MLEHQKLTSDGHFSGLSMLECNTSTYNPTLALKFHALMAKHDFYLKVKFMQKVSTFLANAIAVSYTLFYAVTKSHYRTTKDFHV